MAWRLTSLTLAIALVVTAIPLVRHLRERPSDPPPPIRSELIAPSGANLGAGEVSLDAAISPDGRSIVFVATSAGESRLWRRALDNDRAEPIPGTERATMPAWKRTGAALTFFAEGHIKLLALRDGAISDLGEAADPAGAAWRDDGSLLFVPDARGPVKQMRQGARSDATQLREGDRGHAFPTVTDNGFVYMALRDDGTRVLRLVRNGMETELTRTSSHGAIVNGILVHVRDSVLRAERLDPETSMPRGRAVSLDAKAGVAASGLGAFAVSPRLIVAASARASDRELFWVDASGQRQESILEPGDYWQVRLAPDERHVAVTAVDPLLRALDVFAVPLAAPAQRRRLSLSLGPDSDPTWSSDSARVVYRSQQRGSSQLLSRALAPMSAPEEPVAPTSGDVPSDWRGEQLLVHGQSPAGLDIWSVNTRTGMRTRVTSGGFNESDAQWSPDGRWIAYTSDESGQPDVYVDAWPGGGRRVRVSFAGGRRPQWSRNGRSLLFRRGDEILATERHTDEGTFTTPQPRVMIPALIDFAAGRRSDRLLILAGDKEGEAVARVTTDWQTLVPPLTADGDAVAR